jgi:mannan endo-1,4-beta-mannosidase
MRTSVRRQRIRETLLIVGALWLAGGVPAASSEGAAPSAFATVSGMNFMLEGRPLFVAGVNNHYLSYGSADEVTRVLDDAVAMGANVVRTFNHPVIGSRDGTSVPTIWDWKSKADSSNLGVRGVHMMYWDAQGSRIAFNDGPEGMERLDFLISEAGRRNLKLIVAFLDFWAYTGGAQQMRAWYGSENKETFFFRDPRTKADFKAWILHLLTRVNTRTGIAYKDDPTIFAWELMNEPYIKPPSLYSGWVAEMTAYAKSIDPNHLISSGHVNYDNRMSDGSIATVDFLTWHGYPLYQKLTPDQFTKVITEFCEIGRRYNKPVLLEEFGYARSNADQAEVYRRWLETIRQDRNCAGWVIWRLVSRQDHGRYPEDEHDKFDIRNDGSAAWVVLKEAAGALIAKSRATP